jgi:hypothetical protein
LRYSLDNKSTAKLQELLKMSAGILIGLATERASLHHHDKTRFDLEILCSSADLRPNNDIDGRRRRVITKRLLSHGIGCGWCNGDGFACLE